MCIDRWDDDSKVGHTTFLGSRCREKWLSLIYYFLEGDKFYGMAGTNEQRTGLY